MNFAKIITATAIVTIAFLGCEKHDHDHDHSGHAHSPGPITPEHMENMHEAGQEMAKEAEIIKEAAMSGVYNFKMDDINGSPIDLSQYSGKVLLVVNVASKCGYTRQYEGLEKLYNKYKDQGLVVLGFPANNFGGQEPGTDEQIKQFCSQNYGVTFPMFSKISVKGDDMHPLYAYLTATTGQQVKWNFNKFLVGKDGNVISKFESSVEPMSDELTGKIEELL